MKATMKENGIRKRTSADEKTGMHLYRQCVQHLAGCGTLIKKNTIAIIK